MIDQFLIKIEDLQKHFKKEVYNNKNCKEKNLKNKNNKKINKIDKHFKKC